jgi:hypothetical protein
MAAPKGHRPPYAGMGRPKGATNKVTGDIKAMVDGALAAKGGQKWLEEQADINPVAFMTLIGKCLPKDLNVSGQLGTYTATPIPTEQRHSDTMASAAGTTANRDPA